MGHSDGAEKEWGGGDGGVGSTTLGQLTARSVASCWKVGPSYPSHFQRVSWKNVFRPAERLTWASTSASFLSPGTSFRWFIDLFNRKTESDSSSGVCFPFTSGFSSKSGRGLALPCLQLPWEGFSSSHNGQSLLLSPRPVSIGQAVGGPRKGLPSSNLIYCVGS